MSGELCDVVEEGVDVREWYEQLRRATSEEIVLYLTFSPCKCEDVFIHLGSTHVTTD